MGVALAKIAVFCMKIVYAPLKLFPVKKDRVLFLSRQSMELSLDFRLLEEAIRAKAPDTAISSVCYSLAEVQKGRMAGFIWAVLRSMYYLATSSVCVLDSYWPAVSALRHKKSLTVIQMWHAMGKIKQSGYQTLDKEGGRDADVARVMSMHRNYDKIIAGGPAWNPFYCASFGTTEDKLVNIGLPRLDYILSAKEGNRQEILARYPQFTDKQVLLYAPTFRRGHMPDGWQELLKLVDPGTQVLVLKGHPLQNLCWEGPGVYTCPEFTTVQLLSVADYLITDYSAVAVEAAAISVKTCYYLFDFESYNRDNGLNLSPFDSMPGCAFSDASPLMEMIREGSYPTRELDAYREKYLPARLGHSAEMLADLVCQAMDLG